MSLKKNIILALFVAGLTISLSIGQPVQAHLYGASLEKEVDEYFVDIGHSEYVLEAGDSVRFDFNLFERSAQTKPVEFTDMWVRISQGNKSIFAGGLSRPRLGKTGMTTVFPEPGEYELYVRYHNQDQTLVETTFPISVEPDPNLTKQQRNRNIILAVIGVVGIVTSFLAGLLTSSYLPQRKHGDQK